MGLCLSACVNCVCFSTKHVQFYKESEDFFADWEYVDCETAEKCEWEHVQDDTRDEGLENVLSAFSDARFWPEREMCFLNSASIVSINALFCVGKTEMTRLAAEGRCNEADEIANAILELVHVWGQNVFDSLRMTSFSREDIYVGRFQIKVGQYLKPEPLEGSLEGGAEKLYCFIVYDTEIEKYICTYHLEYHHYGEKINGFYALQLKTLRGKLHIAAYGRACPTYWTLRFDVLRDFSSRRRSFKTC